MYHFRKCMTVHFARQAMIRYRHKKMLAMGKTTRNVADRMQDSCKKFTNCLDYYASRICMYHYVRLFCNQLQAEGTLANFLIVSFLGFVGGVLMTYLLYAFLVLQLYFSEVAAAQTCFFFGPVLTLGLAFSQEVRCMVFLVLPEFFSKRGRQALLAYAFILALTGPGRNTLHNTEVLSSSLACGQEQLKSMARQVVEAIRKPFAAVRDALRTVMRRVRALAVKIRDALLAVKRIVVAIARAIASVVAWLRGVLAVCQNKMGTPYERCSRAFDAAIADCRARLGRPVRWLCSLPLLVKLVCHVLRFLDLLCAITAWLSESVVGVIGRKLRNFVRLVRDAFYVSLETRHTFSMSTSASRSLTEVSVGIATEVRQRAAAVVGAFDWMSSCAALAFTFIIIKAVFFRHRFLSSDQYENMYLTDDLVELDLRRAALGRETLLPLNRREQRYYVPLMSCSLAYNERRRLIRTLVILVNITLKLCIHMCTDYCLYWMLMLIRRHGAYTTVVTAPGLPTVEITGDGILADMLRAVVKAFQPLGISLKVDTVPCLPEPSPPDFTVYMQIATLTAVVWVLAVLEPFGLRLRHLVLRRYHPRRARERAVWLYNHILRQRGTFVKMARRLLRRLLQPGARQGDSIKALLLAKWPCLWVVLGRDTASCSLCAESASERFPLLECPTPGCGARYCEQCFGDIGNMCPGCHSPLDYGDLSDVSLERDSSDEPTQKKLTSEASSTSGFMSSEDEEDHEEDDEGGGERGGEGGEGGGGGGSGDDGGGGGGGGAGADEQNEEQEEEPLLRRRRGPAQTNTTTISSALSSNAFLRKLTGKGKKQQQQRRAKRRRSPASHRRRPSSGRRRSPGRRGRRRHGRRRRSVSSSASSRHSYQYRESAPGTAAPLTAAQRAALGLPAHFRDVEAQSILDLACMQQFYLPHGFHMPDFKKRRKELLRAEYRPGWALRNRRLRVLPKDMPSTAMETSGHSVAGASGDFVNNDYLFAPATPEGSSKSKCIFVESMDSGDTLSNVPSLSVRAKNLSPPHPQFMRVQQVEHQGLVPAFSERAPLLPGTEEKVSEPQRPFPAKLKEEASPKPFLQKAASPNSEVSILFANCKSWESGEASSLQTGRDSGVECLQTSASFSGNSFCEINILHEVDPRRCLRSLSDRPERRSPFVAVSEGHASLPLRFPGLFTSGQSSPQGARPKTIDFSRERYGEIIDPSQRQVQTMYVQPVQPAEYPPIERDLSMQGAPALPGPSSSSPSPPPILHPLDWLAQPDIVRDVSAHQLQLTERELSRRRWRMRSSPREIGPKRATDSSHASSSSSKDSSSPDDGVSDAGAKRRRRFFPYRKQKRGDL